MSVSLPYVWTNVSGTSEFTPAGTTSVKNLPPVAYRASGSADGVGDLGVSLKLGLVDSGEFAMAVRGGATFGTESVDKMTGTGQTSLSGLLVSTWEKGAFALHGQVGYVGATGAADEASPLGVGRFDEFGYVVGADFAPIPERLTLGAEFIGRRLMDAPTFDRS